METKQPTRATRKRRAILAAGAILGIGALIILAAWNDTIWGDGLFGTGEKSWNVQGSFDAGTTWGEFTTQGPAGGTMRFDLNQQIHPENMMPGDSVHALVGIRETEGFLDASVIVAAPLTDEGNTLAEKLTVRIVDLGTDNPGSYDGTGGTQIASYPLAHGVPSAAVSVGKGAEHWLGFTVTLPTGTPPSGLDREAPAWWEFQASSVEP